MRPHEQFWLTIVLAFLPAVFAIAIQWTTQNSPIAKHIQAYKGLVAPYFIAIALLFALFATFLMNDIWVRVEDRAQDLQQSLEREAGALRSLRQIAVALGDNGATIQASVTEYVETSLAEEQKAPNGGASSSINDALQRIADAILHPDLSRGGHAVAQAQLLEIYREIQQARADRAPLSTSQPDLYKWTGVILLGLLTQIAIAMVHMENRRVAAASLFLFTLAVVVTLVVLAISENTIAELTVESLEIIRRSGQ